MWSCFTDNFGVFLGCEVSPGSGRILYSSGSSNSTLETLMRRRIEQQQQAVELQQAIELQGRRFMGLQLLDLKSRSFSSHSNPSNQEQPPPLEGISILIIVYCCSINMY